MSKKEKIICIIAIITTFIIVLVTILVVNKKREEKIEEIRHYAENGFVEEDSNTADQVKPNKIEDEGDLTVYNYYINDDNCDISKLNDEQEKEKAKFYRIINSACEKEAKYAEILYVGDYDVDVRITYTDDTTRDITVLYSGSTTKKFISYENTEDYNKFRNGTIYDE